MFTRSVSRSFIALALTSALSACNVAPDAPAPDAEPEKMAVQDTFGDMDTHPVKVPAGEKAHPIHVTIPEPTT